MNDISLPLLELRSVVDKFEAEPSAAVDKAEKFHENSDEHLVEAKMGALSHDSEKKDLDPILKGAGEAPEFGPIDNLSPSPGNVEVGVDTYSKENMGPAVGTGSWAASTSGFIGFYARGPLSVPTVYSQPQPCSFDNYHRLQAYSFDASSYSPQVPICTPPLPTYSSHAQSYSPQIPAFSPQSPTNSPQIPGSSPQVPVFSPQAPVCSPQAPTYSPRIPVFSPEAPVYSPQIPAYSSQGGTRAEDVASQQSVTNTTNTSESEHGGSYLSRSKTSFDPRVLDRLRYLAQVKAEFADEPGTYDVFMDVLLRFKAEKLDAPGVIRHMREIFDQKPALLEGFKILMLPSYENSS